MVEIVMVYDMFTNRIVYAHILNIKEECGSQTSYTKYN